LLVDEAPVQIEDVWRIVNEEHAGPWVHTVVP
jgi:hypothetical protein